MDQLKFRTLITSPIVCRFGDFTLEPERVAARRPYRIEVELRPKTTQVPLRLVKITHDNVRYAYPYQYQQ